MRPNRNIRIGLALVGLALLLWVGSLVLGRMASRPRPVQVADNEMPQPVTTISVPMGGASAIALEDIPERTIITDEMLEMKALPGDEPSADFVTDKATQAVGFITRRPILKGERLRRAPIDLVGHISDVGIAGAVRPGMRAMVIAIPNKATLHDLVHVGDYIDVIAAFDQQESRTIVQNVRVLAVDTFGRDFPQVKVGMRGDYKADAKGVGVATPPSPPGAPAGTAPPAPTPTPAPPPPSNQPPPRPEPALTLEITPDQATALSLAIASSAPLDFILHPRPNTFGAPEVRVASTTKPGLAPYSTRLKRQQAAPRIERTARREPSLERFNRPERISQAPLMPSPRLPRPSAVQTLRPAPIREDAQRKTETYDIPIYGDGKVVRVDTVRKPGEEPE
jgi:Flp pilus assembly protein CpaB